MSTTNYSFKGKNFNIQQKDIKDADSFEIISAKDDQWVIRYKNQIKHCTIAAFDPKTKSYTILIDDQEVDIQLLDEVDNRIEAMGMNEKKIQALDQLIAPMPGLVINVEVDIGQEVQEGDPLLVLEAMKMENIIKATGFGTVKEILVDKAQTVDKGQVVIKFENR